MCTQVKQVYFLVFLEPIRVPYASLVRSLFIKDFFFLCVCVKTKFSSRPFLFFHLFRGVEKGRRLWEVSSQPDAAPGRTFDKVDFTGNHK